MVTVISLVTVILAADQNNARSILLYQTNLDKIVPLSSHSAMGVSGPNSDLVYFSDYVAKNIALYQLSNNGLPLSTHAQANFCRNELATALRKGPYQVNLLLAGYDSNTTNNNKASLYTMDYLAALAKVHYGVQGYASNFCLSILDRDWREGLTEAQAVLLVDKCIKELQTRFLIHLPNFIVKAIDRDGIRVVKFGADPTDN
jgi:20S proteasome subunit beta 4